MAKVRSILEAFNAGELGDELLTRVSFQKYQLALSTSLNMLPTVQGAVTKRPGTRYVAAQKNQNKSARIVPFEFNVEQAYVLELGEDSGGTYGYARFYRNQGQIVGGDVSVSITNGTFDSGITGWTDQSTGGASIAHNATDDTMQLVGASGETAVAEQSVSPSAATDTEVHVIKFRTIGVPGDNDVVKLRIGTSSGATDIVNDAKFYVGYHCYAFTPGDGNNTIYIQFRNENVKTVEIDDISIIDNAAVEIDTPWVQTSYDILRHAQSPNEMYMMCDSLKPHKLVRNAHQSWSLIEVDFQDGPWLDENTTSTTLTFTTGTAGTVGDTLTASAVTGINGGDGFKSTDVGRLVRVKQTSGSKWAWAIITGYTSTTVVTVDVRGANAGPTTGSPATWRLGAWSDTTGWPRAVTFFQQRMIVGRTSTEPNTVQFSTAADIETFSPDDGTASDGDGTTYDHSAFSYELGAQQANVILSLIGADNLFVLTKGGEWAGFSEGPTLKYNDCSLKRQSKHGAADIQPLDVPDSVMYVQRAGRKIRELAFDINRGQTGAYASPDLTLLAPHITKPGVGNWAWQEEPRGVAWVYRTDGILSSLTYERAQNVVGWGRHQLGGSFISATASIEGATQASPVVVTSTAHGLADGDAISIAGVVGMTELNGNRYVVNNALADTFELTDANGDDVDGGAYTAWSSGGTISHHTAPVVEGLACIPGNDGAGQVVSSEERDEVWLTVKRTINGSTVRYVEFQEGFFEGPRRNEYSTKAQWQQAMKVAQVDAFYVDCGLTYSGSSTTSITGLDHLEGEEVGVWANGAKQEPKTVSSGAVTLDIAATKAQIGLLYTCRGETVKLLGGGNTAAAVGVPKMANEITAVVLDSVNFSIGSDENDLKMINFREVGGGVMPLYTGEKNLSLDTTYKTDLRIRFEMTEPAPLTVVALVPEYKTNEK